MVYKLLLKFDIVDVELKNAYLLEGFRIRCAYYNDFVKYKPRR